MAGAVTPPRPRRCRCFPSRGSGFLVRRRRRRRCMRWAAWWVWRLAGRRRPGVSCCMGGVGSGGVLGRRRGAGRGSGLRGWGRVGLRRGVFLLRARWRVAALRRVPVWPGRWVLVPARVRVAGRYRFALPVRVRARRLPVRRVPVAVPVRVVVGVPVRVRGGEPVPVLVRFDRGLWVVTGERAPVRGGWGATVLPAWSGAAPASVWAPFPARPRPPVRAAPRTGSTRPAPGRAPAQGAPCSAGPPTGRAAGPRPANAPRL